MTDPNKAYLSNNIQQYYGKSIAQVYLCFVCRRGNPLPLPYSNFVSFFHHSRSL